MVLFYREKYDIITILNSFITIIFDLLIFTNDNIVKVSFYVEFTSHFTASCILLNFATLIPVHGLILSCYIMYK